MSSQWPGDMPYILTTILMQRCRLIIKHLSSAAPSSLWNCKEQAKVKIAENMVLYAWENRLKQVHWTLPSLLPHIFQLMIRISSFQFESVSWKTPEMSDFLSQQEKKKHVELIGFHIRTKLDPDWLNNQETNIKTSGKMSEINQKHYGRVSI